MPGVRRKVEPTEIPTRAGSRGIGKATRPTADRFLGIDPGLHVTGYAVLERRGREICLCEAGVIRGAARSDLPTRLAGLHRDLCDVIAAFRPTSMALEQLYSHYEHPTTAILMGHARGVICLAAGQAGVPVFHYPATRVKKLLTGSGHATKAQIQAAVQRELGLGAPPRPHDVADALAIALCHCHGIGSSTPSVRDSSRARHQGNSSLLGEPARKQV